MDAVGSQRANSASTRGSGVSHSAARPTQRADTRARIVLEGRIVSTVALQLPHFLRPYSMKMSRPEARAAAAASSRFVRQSSVPASRK
jgi:hypothetical protein